MAQECGFFNAQLVGDEYDRVYLAEQFAAYFASFIGNGIFGNSMQQLQVKAQDSPNMSTKVLTGEGWINGYWYRNTDEHTLIHSVADGILPRIDTIVLRWSNTDRAIFLHIIEGKPSASPVAPEIERGLDFYDLGLAHVYIPAGAIRITQSQITDLRLNDNYCGLVTGLIEQVDLTGLFIQFEQYFVEFKQSSQAEYKKWFDKNTGDFTDEFYAWFDTLKDQLTEDQAVNLQNQIYSINATLREITEDEIDKIIDGSYQGNEEGGSEPDIYSRITSQEVHDAVDEAFKD